MKITRLKHAKRAMLFYKVKFGIEPPYRILVDGNFMHVAVEQKIHIESLTTKLLKAVKLCTTHCVRHELASLGREFSGAQKIADSFALIRCGHEAKPISPAACLASLLGTLNPHKFAIATQDPELIRTAHRTPGVPLLRINFNLIVVEQPSSKSEKFTAKTERRKLAVPAHERERLQLGAGAPAEPARPRKRKLKGPNPLSVLPKKKKKLNDGRAAPAVAASASGAASASADPETAAASGDATADAAAATAKRRRRRRPAGDTDTREACTSSAASSAAGGSAPPLAVALAAKHGKRRRRKRAGAPAAGASAANGASSS